MTTNKKVLIAGLLIGLIALSLIYSYGRSLWHPLYIKVQGGRSVADVVATLEKDKNLSFDASRFDRIVLLGLKSERVLQVIGRTPEGTNVLIDSFPFTGFSGRLGPKLREGDGQIPEGVYAVEYLNPNSSFHLSIKLNYPNAFDRMKAEFEGRKNLGSDIFIHGKSATIGCIPIGDDAIEKLFLMVAETGMQHVDIIVAPYDMRIENRPVEVEAVEWENELYALIRTAMEPLKIEVEVDTDSFRF